MSAAIAHAEFLEGLAGHLRAHPELPRVGTISRDYPERWDLHLSDGAANVLAWARSLGVSNMAVQAVKDWHSVRVFAALAGHDVRVWARVDGLPEGTPVSLTLAELEHVAGHGSLPGVSAHSKRHVAARGGGAGGW